MRYYSANFLHNLPLKLEKEGPNVASSAVDVSDCCLMERKYENALLTLIFSGVASGFALREARFLDGGLYNKMEDIFQSKIT